MPTLIITADDYGYSPPYDGGILLAARAGAVDAVSVLVLREALDPEPLLTTGVELGLHLELDPHDDGAERAARLQVERFGERLGRGPAYLDGHHHCHAKGEAARAVALVARDLRLPVRSIDVPHRRLLRAQGVATPDLLVGRLGEDEPALPPELAGPGRLPSTWVVEWMVHPGHRDPARRSAYDAGRQQDLDLLLAWAPPTWLHRSTHAIALGHE